MASRDRPLLVALQQALGAGALRDIPPRYAHWQPTTEFRIFDSRVHLEKTIPFFDGFLLPSAKREQFDEWRARLEHYLATRPTKYGRGPSPCSRPGCEKPVRGQGVCRSHYYEITGY